jgi:hypothetical protein
MSFSLTSRAGLAGAAALLALSTIGMQATAHAAQKEQPTRCYGANTCKGTSLCATAKNDCKGLNECKGQGVILKTPTECKKLGGSLTEKA